MKFITSVWNGKKMCEVYKYGAKWYQVQWFYAKRAARKTLIVATILVSVAWTYTGAFLYGFSTQPTIALAKEIVKIQVEVESKDVSPVLKRIAKCESGGVHYKNGQVIMKANTNGTVDIGKYQINSVWAKKATELKLDLTKESDNEAMAKWIYANRGTEDWYPSKQCWSK